MARPSPAANRAASRSSPPTADGGFPLLGTSNLPDPQFHAYRKDLADAALAGQVIASHYADPLERRLIVAADLHSAPGSGSEVLASLNGGDPFALLDSRSGWAWGYAGGERRVGYVRAEALER